MKKRIFAALLACLLLAGCGPVRTDPADAQLWDTPPGAERVIAYVPLDDRPDNDERVIYLAESLGYTLAMPERDLYHTALDGQPLNANGTQSGDRAALYAWVLEQEAAGCDRYILFMDQLLSGGLVNSRHMTAYQSVTLPDGRVLTERELLEELLVTLAADEDNRVWLLDSVMRLAPTVGYAGFGLEEYNALREYGMQARPELAEGQLSLERVLELYGKDSGGADLVSSDFGLEAEQVAAYLNARLRKLELADHMLRLVNHLGGEFYPGLSGENFRVLMGVDDSSEENSIQKNEIAFLRTQLREGDALLSGVDDLAFKAVAKLYLEETGWNGANVCVRYYGGTEDQPACAYDYKPLTEIVEEHFAFFGLTETEEPARCDLMLLVLTQPADEAKKTQYYEQLIREVKNRQDGDHPPVMLIDAGNARYGTAFHKALTNEVELGWLLSYAGALDMAIVTGTALSHGVARYARLRYDSDNMTQLSERAFLRTVADSVLKDFCYRHVVRAEVTAYARDTLGGVPDNFWDPEIDREALLALMERRMTEEAAAVMENLERSNFISALAVGGGYAERGWGGIALDNYRFPWDRAFEMSMDIRLGEWTEPHKSVLGLYYK